MKNLRQVMIFIGINVRSVINLILISFFLFIFTETAIIIIFFVIFNPVEMTLIQIVILFIPFMIFIVLKNISLKKKRWRLNMNFHEFLDSNSGNGFEKQKYFYTDCMSDLKSLKKNSKLFFIPYFSKLAVSTPIKKTFRKQNSFRSEIKILNKNTFKIYIVSSLFSLIIYLPFLLISYLFTINLNLAPRVLIILSGIMFFMFIKVSVIDTITQLLVKKCYHNMGN